MDQQILLLGIIEENHNRNILKITKELLMQSDYKLDYENIGSDIICYCNKDRILIIFDLILSEINKYNLSNFNFDFMIHSLVEDNETNDIKKMLSKSKVCIVNSDIDNLSSLLSNLEDTLVITYGLNSKSTITISSYNINTHTDVNLCLQRVIIPLTNEKIEPFEFNIKVSYDNEDLLYPILSASTLNLLLGDSILNKKPYENIILNIES